MYTLTDKITTFFGSVFFSVVLKSGIGWTTYKNLYFTYKKLYEDPYYSLFENYPSLLDKGHIIDVGANIGYNSLLFSKYKPKSDFKIFSFEPDPYIYRYLLKTIKESKSGGVIKCFETALSDKNEIMPIEHNFWHVGNNKILKDAGGNKKTTNTTKVRAVTLDMFLDNRKVIGPVKFVKIDVQGHEFNVLKGMKDTIKNNSNIVVTLEILKSEIENNDKDVANLNELLSTRFKYMYLISRHGKLMLIDTEYLMDSDFTYVNVILTSEKLVRFEV